MALLETLENRFFREGPQFCRRFAAVVFLAGLALAALPILLSQEGSWFSYFGFAALVAVPAIMLALLSFALTQRHWTTIPLVVAICLFVARYFLHTPESAFEGIRATPLMFVVGWVLFLAEIAALCFAIWFMWYLWSKGVFR